jgi:hypothetical protein
MVILSGANMEIKVVGDYNDNSEIMLLAFPKELLNYVIIAPDGSVDASSLVNALRMTEENESLTEAQALQEHIELMANIFDESRAADFNHSTLRP